MKKKNLTPFFFLFFLIPFYPIHAQEPVSSSGIIIEGRYFGVTLNNILDDFEKKYGLELDLVPADLPGGIHPGQVIDKVDLNTVMQTLLDGTGLHYKLVGRRLIIRKIGQEITYKEKEKTKPGRKDFILYGRVKDKESGETLPYAQILVDGTLNGTTTNIDGYFTLFHVPVDTAAILVRYVGYHPKIVRLDPDMAL